jgi:hypothetical protein
MMEEPLYTMEDISIIAEDGRGKLMEYEAKRILVNAGIVVGILVVGFLAFFGVLKLFSVLANIPFP